MGYRIWPPQSQAKSHQKSLKICVIVGLLACVSGCATRTVVIDSRADVVRLGKGVHGPVYLWDKAAGAWTLVKDTKLPEGWFAGPPPS